jgi:hypothetical protein
MGYMDELKASEWFRTRPKIIQEAIEKYSPENLYEFKDSGKQCFIVGYTEPKTPDGKVTLIVEKTGKGGPMAGIGFGALDTNKVFGIDPESLKVVEESTPPSP